MSRHSHTRRRSLHSPASRENLDVYLVLELTKTQYSVRSFALGGCPYFEANGTLPRSDSLVEDIISGHLSPAVMALFDGIDIAGKSIMCFVCDARQSIVLNYSVLLGPENQPGLDFRITHTNSLSESVAGGELQGVKARQPRNSAREKVPPAE